MEKHEKFCLRKFFSDSLRKLTEPTSLLVVSQNLKLDHLKTDTIIYCHFHSKDDYLYSFTLCSGQFNLPT